MCSTGRGLWGHSCPINPPDLSASSSEAARQDFIFVFAVTYSRQRPAVCISLGSSFGCVFGNEMTLSVMHLVWLSRSWSLCIYLTVPLHATRIYITYGGRIVVTGDHSWWSFYDSPPHRLDWRGNLCCQFHCIPSWLSCIFHFWGKKYIFPSLPLYGCPVPDGYQTIVNPPKHL